MKRKLLTRLAAVVTACAASVPLATSAEDIDIFLGAQSGGGAGNPNVLLVLDNSSNWSRNDQQWPNEKQGESELQALKEVIASVGETVNVGLMMFTDNGTGREGGYIRYHVRPMTDANKASLIALLDQI
ncbi:MAG: pilus assembly protein PilY, partial [Burkholderiales bacterium]